MVALVDPNVGTLYNYAYDGSPDIRVELVDKCPSGGGETVIRTSARAPFKWRLRMREGVDLQYNFHNRCLYVRATVEHANYSFNLWTADYYYSNSRVHHDM